jgi:hypothetical protein
MRIWRHRTIALNFELVNWSDLDSEMTSHGKGVGIHANAVNENVFIQLLTLHGNKFKYQQLFSTGSSQH